MKLSAIYANKRDIFPPIKFDEGFNVVFARVKDPHIKENDSHNLGKTLLISVIDFCLLGGTGKQHPFVINAETFKDFAFYLELLTHSGRYVTVLREVEGKKPIKINVSQSPNTNFDRLFEPEWSYDRLSLTNAKKVLNDLLDLSALEPYNYRKGLGYVLRRQADYDDVFRTEKFSKGRDQQWKPFLAQLLGFDRELVNKKYVIDDGVKNLKIRQRDIEQEAGSKSEEYDEVRGMLEIRSSAVDKIRMELERFSFRGVEEEMNTALVSEIERQISDLNSRRYTIDYELTQINNSIVSGFDFDLNRVQQVFHEVNLELPQSLVRSYEELIDFNRRMSESRNKRLKELKTALTNERRDIEDSLTLLDEQRALALAALQEQETLEKFRALQRHFIEQEAEVLSLRQQLTELDRAANIQKDIDKQQQQSNEAIQEIRQSVYKDNDLYTTIRTTFSNCVERVLNVPALLSVSVNQSGNLDFNVRTIDRNIQGRETSESLGTSYKKLLCACFDIALLSAYADKPFYHFIYHDGIFEGLDNRKKVNLLELIRETCTSNNIQYILTVIDSDLPRDNRDDKLLFSADEVVRDLHDDGDEGRLFRMEAF